MLCGRCACTPGGLEKLLTIIAGALIIFTGLIDIRKNGNADDTVPSSCAAPQPNPLTVRPPLHSRREILKATGQQMGRPRRLSNALPQTRRRRRRGGGAAAAAGG